MDSKLRDLFQGSFNYEKYRKLVIVGLFHCTQPFKEPELLDDDANGDIIYGLGRTTDIDGKEIGFYYTKVNKGDVTRKRVGFHKMMQPYVKYGVEAAIAVFDDGRHWRLSYICDLKGGATSAKRFSYVVGDPAGHYNTPSHRLAQLGMQSSHLRLSDIYEAFSVEALSKEFFDGYHRHYDRILKSVADSLIDPNKDAVSNQANKIMANIFADYVKKMMGRIVFLHFLQKKGWLNDNQDFLRDLFFMQPLNRRADFLETVLEPLFFGIFNTEVVNREKVFRENGWDLDLLKQWKALPYLNGGLFERDGLDQATLKLQASLFEDLFTFMSSYNFTVDENDPDDAEIGVDPEMLGKIFESLLEDNKAKGAFYTPKEIVRYMCKESLIAYLVGICVPADAKDVICVPADAKKDTTSVPADAKDSIRTFVETHEMQPELEPYRDSLDQALRNVKICDPAIGSGAFPMGLLNELWRCREALEESDCVSHSSPKLGDGTSSSGVRRAEECVDTEGRRSVYSRAALKKEIIENNIYGVDIEKGAIDIARLRFWLSIVVDAKDPEPLPNFDYKFMQGNSLIESFEGFDLSRISSKLRGGQSKSMQLILGLDSHTSRQNLQRLLREYFSVTDHKQKDSMRQAINEEVKTLIRESIGGTPDSLKRLANMDPSANQDFFLWHTWFKDIFDNGGFDIVIGNPPYISAPTQIANEHLELQRERIIESKKYKSLYQKWDLYIPFIELGMQLIDRGGITTMIVPFPLTNQLYARTMRKMLVEDANLYELVDLNGTKIFDNATVSNCIPFIKKTKTRGETWISNINDNFEIQRTFVQKHRDLVQDEKTYVWNVTQEKRVSNRHQGMHVLGDFCYVSKGMVLNSDEKSVGGKFKKADLVSDNYDSTHCRKFLEGKDCGKYVYHTIRYLEYDTKRVPDLLSRPTFRELYTTPKLMFNRLGELQVFLDEHGDITTSDAMFVCLKWDSLSQVNNKSISSSIKKFCSMSRHEMEKLSHDIDLRYILGIMNSRYAAILLTNLRAGDYHIYPEHIRNIPIPIASQEEQQKIINIVNEILKAKQSNPTADNSTLEHQIDQLVYALYDLTSEEIAIIEQ